MINSHKWLYFLLGGAIFVTLHFSSCKPAVACTFDQVKIGEIQDGIPQLTYSNMPKLKRAMLLAFSPGMRLDTMFLHAEVDDTGNEQIILTASGQETDSTYTSVNFFTRQINGISLITGPVLDNPNPEPIWCASLGDCNKCHLIGGFECICAIATNNGDCTKDAIAEPGGGGTVRPVDMLDIIVPYLIAP